MSKQNWKEGWFWNGFVFDVRGFGCVPNQVPNTYGKSAQTTKVDGRVELKMKTSHYKSRALSESVE